MTSTSDAAVAALLRVVTPRDRRRPGRRILQLDSERIERADLEAAVQALSIEAADAHVDAAVTLELLEAVGRLRFDQGDPEPLYDIIAAHVRRRWESYRAGFANEALNSYHRGALYRVAPQLMADGWLLDGAIAKLSDSHAHGGVLHELLREIAPSTLADARRMIFALDDAERGHRATSDETLACVSSAIGRGLEWSPWASLFALLRCVPEYSDPHADFSVRHDRSRHSELIISARQELAAALEPQRHVREVAELLLMLFGSRGGWSGLLDRPAEVRSAFVEALRTAVGDDGEIRAAAIEALLWRADGRIADLAQFAATALAEPSDREFLASLGSHPSRLVQFSARAVLAAKFGEPLRVDVLPQGRGLLHGLLALQGQPVPTDEPPKTWIGDRAVERLIEQTLAAIEARSADEYADHGDEGEGNLLSALFREMAIRFQLLDQTLASLALASVAPYRASVGVRYRNIDRHEEGRAGIKGADAFSADLCLVVDPILEGVSLGRRVTLVQAKRLYRNRDAAAQPAWRTNFLIDAGQVDNLLKQTASSVYMFEGPPLGGRGLPVIPTRLVADLSRHPNGGGNLPREWVATASRSLSDWFTYDLLGLRIGDPYEMLVEKVEGRPGSLPRALLELPTIEMEVAVASTKEE